jgi:hypothetical protein
MHCCATRRELLFCGNDVRRIPQKIVRTIISIACQEFRHRLAYYFQVLDEQAPRSLQRPQEYNFTLQYRQERKRQRQ